MKKALLYITVFMAVLAMLTDEVEGRRKILKGRKALTRTYFRDSAIPAWAVVLLVALGEIAVGGIMYVIMKKLILDVTTASYTPANQLLEA